MTGLLQSLRILVTRPAPQNQTLLKLIRHHGGHAIALPLISIESENVIVKTDELNQYDFLIFTSANAVKPVKHLLPAIHEQTQLVAIGGATAKALSPQYVLAAPEPFNSEALLTLSQFQQLQQKKILIVKGHQGRQFLSEQLQERGAQVEELLVYRRHVINYAELANDSHQFDCAIVTSNEILNQYYQCLVEQQQLEDVLQRPLVVIGDRQAQLARKLNFTTLLVAHSATDDAILNQLLQWREMDNDK